MSQDPLPPLPQVRTGQTPTKLTKEEYLKRWRQEFFDPAFMSENGDLDAIAEIAWDAYQDERKSPRTRKAGPGFADPQIRAIGRMAGSAAGNHRRAEASRIA